MLLSVFFYVRNLVTTFLGISIHLRERASIKLLLFFSWHTQDLVSRIFFLFFFFEKKIWPLILTMQTQGITTVVWLSEILLPPSKQAIHETDFPWCQDLRDNWETIREEYIHFQTHHHVTSVTEVYPNFDNLNMNNTYLWNKENFDDIQNLGRKIFSHFLFFTDSTFQRSSWLDTRSIYLCFHP